MEGARRFSALKLHQGNDSEISESVRNFGRPPHRIVHSRAIRRHFTRRVAVVRPGGMSYAARSADILNAHRAVGSTSAQLRSGLLDRSAPPNIGVTLAKKTREFIEVAFAPVRFQVGQYFDILVCEDRHIAILNFLQRLTSGLNDDARTWPETPRH